MKRQYFQDPDIQRYGMTDVNSKKGSPDGARRFERAIIDFLKRGILNLAGNRLSNSADPLQPQDLATKAYVDNAGGGGSAFVTADILGTDTDSFVSIYDHTCDNYGMIDLQIKNTGSNRINLRFTIHDAFGDSNVLTDNVDPGMTNFMSALSVYPGSSLGAKRFILEVKTEVPGDFSNFSLKVRGFEV